jgi:hypothetical protein
MNLPTHPWFAVLTARPMTAVGTSENWRRGGKDFRSRRKSGPAVDVPIGPSLTPLPTHRRPLN